MILKIFLQKRYQNKNESKYIEVYVEISDFFKLEKLLWKEINPISNPQKLLIKGRLKYTLFKENEENNLHGSFIIIFYRCY